MNEALLMTYLCLIMILLQFEFCRYCHETYHEGDCRTSLLAAISADSGDVSQTFLTHKSSNKMPIKQMVLHMHSQHFL